MVRLPEFRLTLFSQGATVQAARIETKNCPHYSAFRKDIFDVNLDGHALQYLVERSEAAPRQRSSRDELQMIGSRLFDILMDASPSVELAWDLFCGEAHRREARFVLTCHDERVANLPWECLFDGANMGFVALRIHFLRGLRNLDVAPSVAPLQLRPGALVAACNPFDDLCLDKEINGCNPFWDDIFEKVSVLKDGTKKQIIDALCSSQWDIFHYAGHSSIACRIDEPALSWIEVRKPGRNGRAEALYADELADFLSSAGIQLVFLNSCWSGQHRGGSLLDIFAEAGIPNVVAMNQDAGDLEAATFASAFYESLAAKSSLEQALTWARKQVCEKSDTSSMSWGLPTATFLAPDMRFL